MISSMELRETDKSPGEPPTTEAIVSEAIEEIRVCSSVSLPLCLHLPYNSTAYPNLVGHASKDALMRDLVAFRELLDAECSHLAQVCPFYYQIRVRPDTHRKYLQVFEFLPFIPHS